MKKLIKIFDELPQPFGAFIYVFALILAIKLLQLGFNWIDKL